MIIQHRGAILRLSLAEKGVKIEIVSIWRGGAIMTMSESLMHYNVAERAGLLSNGIFCSDGLDVAFDHVSNNGRFEVVA